jgi:flagellin
MPQVISTNLPSLNAQKNLEISSSGYTRSLQRLSSGLRINSAKDDAAGLAISSRMQGSIQGLTVAKRNANDAISLSQIAEGALQETTKMLQRIRELAVQAANGTNSPQDRNSLNEEVNQLKDELSRTANFTTFNGLKILNGDLAATSFQVGPEQNQFVMVSIDDTSTNSMGINDIKPTHTDGIMQANYDVYMEGSASATAYVTSINAVAAPTNGIGASVLRFEKINSDTSIIVLPTVTVTANDSASRIASNVNAAAITSNYVHATAYTDITITNLVYTTSTAANLSFTLKDQTNTVQTLTLNGANGVTASYSSLAMLINNNNNFAAAGVYAIASPSSLRVISNLGHDLSILASAGGAANDITCTVTQYDEAGASLRSGALASVNAAARQTLVPGILGLELAQNTTLKTVGGLNKDTNSMLFDTTQTQYDAGLLSTASINRVQAQTLTISGNDGSVDLPILANSSAATIATSINNKSGSTGVTATAATTLNIQNISSAGTVTFDIYGDNMVTPVTVSAEISTTDYGNLVRAINDYSGSTGVIAQFDSSEAIVRLSNTNGNNIRIANFKHSAGVKPQDVTVTKLGSVDGSTLLVPRIASMEIVGNPTSNAGQTVTLFAGGGRQHLNSTVVGGKLLFSSPKSLSVSSNVDGNIYSGSLFTGAALTSNASTFTALSAIDISTVDGARDSLRIVDRAIDQISSIRSSLGATQSRFESVIRNISDNIENLSAAKSRVTDTDFAAETAELSKTQILTQAGLSIVAQANSIPQNILSLLQ